MLKTFKHQWFLLDVIKTFCGGLRLGASLFYALSQWFREIKEKRRKVSVPVGGRREKKMPTLVAKLKAGCL